MQHIGDGEAFGGAIQQAAVGAFQGVGRQRRHQRIGLDQHGEAGQRALLLAAREARLLQGRPHGILDIGRDAHAFGGEQRRDPLQGKGDFAGLVDARQRLQGQRALQARARCSRRPWPAPPPARAAAVEEDDLGADEAAELQGEQRQQHGFAGAGRARRISVWPTSPTCRSSRNGVLPRVSVIISGGAFRCRLASGPAHTADTGIMWARFRVCTIGWRTLA